MNGSPNDSRYGKRFGSERHAAIGCGSTRDRHFMTAPRQSLLWQEIPPTPCLRCTLDTNSHFS
jgi:hypothetical protein